MTAARALTSKADEEGLRSKYRESKVVLYTIKVGLFISFLYYSFLTIIHFTDTSHCATERGTITYLPSTRPLWPADGRANSGNRQQSRPAAGGARRNGRGRYGVYHALKDQIETLRRPNSIVFARGGATACRSSCRDGHVSYVTRSFQALLLTGEATELRTMQTRDKRGHISESARPGLGSPHC